MCQLSNAIKPMTCALIGIEWPCSEEIERYQVAMATSSRPFSLQEATEW